MKKQTKIILSAAFVILVGLAAFLGYSLATGGLSFSPKNEIASSTDGNQSEGKKTAQYAYAFMEEPSYNEYALEYIQTGNLLGNLFAGGRVAPTLSTVYQSIPDVGIFKFSQSTEDTSFLSIPSETGAPQDYVSLNRIEGKMVYIDNKNGGLYVTASDGTGRVKLAGGATQCFVYGQTVYYTTEQGVYSVPVSGGSIRILFQKVGWQFTLVGLSNSRIYFCAQDGSVCRWLSVSLRKPDEGILRFMEDTQGREITGVQYTEGWLYYLKGKSGGSNLYRKQIGVENETLLAEDVTQFVVDKNCIYFGRTIDGAYQVWERNTANDAEKIVLTVPYTGAGEDVVCYAGGEYIYAISKPTVGQALNCRTCLWTAANDLMYYNSATRSWSTVNG